MVRERPILEVPRERVRRARLRLRVPDPAADESAFILVSLVAGSVLGYVVALL